MISHKHVELAVRGTIAKAADIARKHGQYAQGHEAKISAVMIANEIETLDDILKDWEEAEAAAQRETVKRKPTKDEIVAIAVGTMRAKGHDITEQEVADHFDLMLERTATSARKEPKP